MQRFFAKHLLLIMLCLNVCAVSAHGAPAQDIGKVSGIISDAIGHPLSGATISIKDASGKVMASSQSNAQGHFTISGLPPGVYVLTADKAAYKSSIKVINLVSKQALYMDMVLASTKALEIQVSAKRMQQARNAISVETGSSVYKMNTKTLATLPQGRNTPLDKVILQAPGVAQDSYGQIHIRGDHGDVQYRINDIIIPESITGFGQALDTRFAESVDLLTGALPAQYGYRTAGVVSIHTKSGALGQGGRIGVMGGSNNTRKAFGEASGSQGSFSYYVTGAFEQNDLGIEKPTPAKTVLHDRTVQRDGFVYLSDMLNDTSQLSLIAGNAQNDFQIPNNPNQTQTYTYNGVSNYPSSQLNENQREITRYGILALQQSLDNGINYQISAFTRYSQVVFSPDPVGDLIYTGVAANINRSSLASGVQMDASYKINAHHTLRTGLFYSNEHAVNDSDSLVFPTSGGVQSSTTPISIIDNSTKVSQLEGIYIQDEWRPTHKLTFNYGLREDWVNAYVTGNQLSPRIGVVYQATPSTTLHAGYARYYTPPPTELIAPTTVASFQNTTNAPPGSGNDPVKAQSSNYYDAGVSQRFGSFVTVGLDGYYRQVTNLLDEGQFGSAMIFTPFNYAHGRIYGVELSASYHRDNLSAYLNLARATALGKGIVSAQYNFDPAELNYIATHWIHLDHDQMLTGSGGISYAWQHTTAGLDAIYGSGLRNGFANTSHLPGYVQINGTLVHHFKTEALGDIEGRINVVNIFDKIYLIRDGTGVGVGAPQYGPRRSFYAELSKLF
jgi:outer membrane receptor protein involved in Fe transport